MISEGQKTWRVLVSAYACEPGKGSEPGIGWNWVQQIARLHEVWVITRANNRGPIEAALQQNPLPNAHWIYFDLPYWARFWKRGQRGIHLYYYLWQIGAYFVGKRLHAQEGIDLVHHATFGIYWFPSFLAFLPIPFIWGTIGGGESAPRSFYKTFSLRGKAHEYLRDLARWLAQKRPIVRLMARRARVALATTQETATRLRQLGSQSVEILPHVALPCEEWAKLAALPMRQSYPFRLASLGRLTHWKGFHLGLMAFAQFQEAFPSSEYWFIGDGPERQRLERLASELRVTDKIRFWGRLPRSQALELLADCDVLVFPSLHDSGGWACAEAMAAGCPVICLDLGGPALQVTEETGIKVPAISPEQVTNDITEAMLRLARDPNLRARKGVAGRKRVIEHFYWPLRGLFVSNMYSQVLNDATKD